MIYIKKDIDIETLFKAIATYGSKAQEDIAIEEMAELTKALIKNRRYNTDATRKEVREEMADVYIMLLQLVLMYGFDEKVVKNKIDRLKNRLEKKQSESADKTFDPLFRCEKCGKAITKEEVITGCRACSSKSMSRYEYLKELPVENMAAVIAGMIILNVVSVTGEPINSTIKKLYTRQVFEWLLGELEDNEKA